MKASAFLTLRCSILAMVWAVRSIALSDGRSLARGSWKSISGTSLKSSARKPALAAVLGGSGSSSLRGVCASMLNRKRGGGDRSTTVVAAGAPVGGGKAPGGTTGAGCACTVVPGTGAGGGKSKRGDGTVAGGKPKPGDGTVAGADGGMGTGAGGFSPAPAPSTGHCKTISKPKPILNSLSVVMTSPCG